MIKTASSGFGQTANVAGERALIERVRQQNGLAFSIILRQAVLDRYNDPGKGAKLREEHQQQIRAGNRTSPAEFMLWKLSQPARYGGSDVDELRGKIHKAVFADARLFAEEDATKGVLAFREPHQSLDSIAADEPQVLRRHALPERFRSARGLGWDMRRAIVAIDGYVDRIAEPQGNLVRESAQ